MVKSPETVKNSPFGALTQQVVPEASVLVQVSQTGINISMLSLTELMQLREDIHRRLPPRKLAELDLEEELVLQFQQGKALFNAVVADQNVPTNQRAQVANSCTALLEHLTKLQDSLYNSERIKALELALVRAIRDLPEEQQLAFFANYEKIYAESRGAK